MTPAARVAAAIDVLDQIILGDPAEKVLTRWGRQNRYAGSKDRAAVRDYVFDCLRQWRMAAHLGGAETGRALMIGLLRNTGVDPADLFTGDTHAPRRLAPAELAPPAASPSRGTAWNIPDWLIPEFERSLGETAEVTAIELQRRAPVGVRVNTRKLSVAEAIDALGRSEIEAIANPVADTALTVVAGERRLRQSDVFLSGGVELQDASSQAVVALLPDATDALDYCAGGGGKALAMAARYGRPVFTHDIEPNRMSDIPKRAKRAGAKIICVSTPDLSHHGPYDLVLCDAPCSGSGAWRRSPEGKWKLTHEKLNRTLAAQDCILDAARTLVKPGGVLAYATCSVLRCENEDRVAAFLNRHPEWALQMQTRLDVSSFGDGFFTAHLTID